VSDAGSWQLRAGVEFTESLPAQLSELICARLQPLGATVSAVLAAATVLGAGFRFAELRRVIGFPDDALLDALDAALAGQWIEESADGYRFRYPLVRHTLSTALSRERRAQLRRRAAEARQVDGG
jgi:predicted ATPase